MTREEAIKKSIEYFNGDELAASVFVDKYALRDDEGNVLEATPDDLHERLATEFARIEQKYPNALSKEEIFDSLKDFEKIVPQGSPMAGVGNSEQLMSVSNCFVIGSPEDSYGGIMKADEEIAQLSKRRAGIGLDITNIRPKGVVTRNAARTTDGIGVFMDRFSNTCREVAQNGRRGAELQSISVHHPEVETFITIKNNKTRVTGANISVKLSEEFMLAVKNNTQYEQRWPVNSPNPQICKMESAKKIWDMIIENAWASAEPGLLFWDNVEKNTPSEAYDEYKAVSTNPCGEIILSPYDSCRLVSMNTLGFVKNNYTPESYFDYEEFSKYVKQAQKYMDDIVDIELEQIEKILIKIDSDPEDVETKKTERNLWEKIRRACERGRRTGLGVTAIGDTLAALGIVYGSPKSIEVVEKIYKTLEIAAYEASIEMAKERGSFPAFDYDKEQHNSFICKIIDNVSEEHKEMYKQYGRRNIALTTTAPAGSVSILTQTSSGIEPVFMLSYSRRKKINPSENIEPDFVDSLGDKWRTFKVYHHELKNWMDVTGETDETKSPWFGGTAQDVDWVASVELQAAAQKWVCHSISKTCNLPNSATKEMVADVYMRAWESGCKGFTVYRDGCRDGVLVTETKKEEKEVFQEHNAPKRPSSLECDIHQVKIKGEAWTIFVGLMDGKPYEIMGGKSSFVNISKKIVKGQLVKNSKKAGSNKSIYDLHYGDDDAPTIIKDVVRTFENPTEGEFSRMVSLALRHGSPVQYIVEQLQKDEEGDLYSFSKVLSRVLKTYIKDGIKVKEVCKNCGSTNLVYQEGCLRCSDCNFTKCG